MINNFIFKKKDKAQNGNRKAMYRVVWVICYQKSLNQFRYNSEKTTRAETEFPTS